MKLHGPDHWTWLGLRRVNCGAIARFEGAYYDGGRSIPGCLFPILIDALIDRELLAVIADPDKNGWQRVVLSDTGRAEYWALCRLRRHRSDTRPRLT